MMEPGRVCIKIAGRNAGAHCVIVDNIDENFVLIDGNVKRKKCNIKHLEPLDLVLKIRKGASTSSVHEAMKEAKLKVITTNPKQKKSEKPRKQRKSKIKENKPVKADQKKDRKDKNEDKPNKK